MNGATPRFPAFFSRGKLDALVFLGVWHMGVEPKIVGFAPQIIHLFIGFSILFTIHFGVPLFLVQHPYPTAITIKKNKNPSQVLLLVLSADVRVLRELPGFCIRQRELRGPMVLGKWGEKMSIPAKHTPYFISVNVTKILLAEEKPPTRGI